MKLILTEIKINNSNSLPHHVLHEKGVFFFFVCLRKIQIKHKYILY